MLAKLRAKNAHVLFAKDDKVVETFLLDRLHESFNERDGVR